jgi:hypothetical protein
MTHAVVDRQPAVGLHLSGGRVPSRGVSEACVPLVTVHTADHGEMDGSFPGLDDMSSQDRARAPLLLWSWGYQERGQ